MNEPLATALDIEPAAAPRAAPHRLLLEVRSVSQTFRTQRGETVQAVRGVSLTVGVGETVAIVGESGSGKSSLARIVLGLAPPDSGEVIFDGLSLDPRNARVLRQRRKAMQPVFQDSAAAFNPRRTVFEVLAQALGQADVPSPKRSLDDAAAELLTHVRLTPARSFFHRLPHELSGGQRQRLAIARAIAVSPRLIVADEPLSGADISIRGQILNLLLDLQRDRATSYLFITHDMAVAREFAHRVLVMYRGEIVESGPAREVCDAPHHEYTRALVGAAMRLQ